MYSKYYIGWVRDAKGNIISRPVKTISNAITTFVGGGHTDKVDGLGHTVPHIVYRYE